jgi:hypothetical protein
VPGNLILPKYFLNFLNMATCIFLSFHLSNEQELVTGINLGMALTPFPSSIG